MDMKAVDKKVFQVVAGIHIGLIVLIMGGGFLQGCFRRAPDRVIPVEFLVDVRQPSEPESPFVPDEDPTAPDPEPEPEPEPDPVPPEPRDRTIQVNTNRIIRRIDDQPDVVNVAPNPLSPEEIQILLDEGAQASDRTVIPDADGKGLAIIRRTLYSIWDTPSRAAVGDSEATLEISLGAGGVVKSARVIVPSGNPVMDASVAQVAGSISRIHGLPNGFVERRPRVTIAFSVQ
jgi:TonB family protein